MLTHPRKLKPENVSICGFAKWFPIQQEDDPDELHVGAACDGVVVTGIQIRAQAGDIAADRSIKNTQ